MDYLQDQLSALLANSSISPSTIKTLYSYTASMYASFSTLSTYISTLLPFLPSTLPTTLPQLISLTLFALTLFTAFKILDYVRRLIQFWVFLAIKLVAVLALVQLALYVHTYGIERTLGELGWMWGFVEGWLENVNANANIPREAGRGWGDAGGRQRAGKGYANAKRPTTRGRWT